ncbi:hypothetical protein E3N88_02910 [Mikania micrantha]|uniref:Uncharacterized protein n=1 Tax=Mikania micrantha TaxID=192012 RepID=A0A5N6Q524_9ASTR|nr:hypothetical protein E3N88_02910 [Mikania micrantha]
MPISPPSPDAVKDMTLAKTSGAPFPKGSRVVPAIAGERFRVFDRLEDLKVVYVAFWVATGVGFDVGAFGMGGVVVVDGGAGGGCGICRNCEKEGCDDDDDEDGISHSGQRKQGFRSKEATTLSQSVRGASLNTGTAHAGHMPSDPPSSPGWSFTIVIDLFYSAFVEP